jgi:hypothetical protein
MRPDGFLSVMLVPGEEDFMPMRNAHSIARSAGSDRFDGLLVCRMEMLGVDADLAQQSDPAAFAVVRQMCSACAFHEACAIDLKRDPNSPVWETYCPGAGTLLDLAAGQSAAV